MATTRWYLANALVNSWSELSTTAQGAATIPGGWVVGTGTTNSSEWNSTNATDRASTTFVGNTVPDGTLDTTLFDAFRTTNPINGTFAAANWSIQFAVVSTIQAGAHDGAAVFRLIKADADGSNPTLITAAQQTASTATNVGATDINSTLTFNPGAITITNQYLFVQMAWKRIGAGGMTTTNIRLRTGSAATPTGTTILSSDFTPADQAVTTEAIALTSVVNVATVINTQLVTTDTIASGSSVNASTVETIPDQDVDVPAFASTGQVFAPTVAPDQAVALSFIRPGLAFASQFIGFEEPLYEGGAWGALGNGWADILKDDGAYCAVASGTAHLTASPGNAQYSDITYDQNPGASSWVGVTTRMQSGTPRVYLAIAYDNEVRLYVVMPDVGLTFTLLTSASASIGTAPRRLRLESEGTTHRVYFNGELKITYTDSTYSSGKIGIAASTFGGPEVKIQSYEGGDLVTQVFVPTIVPDQAVLGTTIAEAAGTFAPTVTAVEIEAQSVYAATINGGDTFSAVLGGLLLGAYAISAPLGVAQVFAPEITEAGTDQTVTGATIVSASLAYVPTVAPGAITIGATTIAATALVQVPTVVPGAITITGATVVATAVVQTPTVATGPVSITGATCLATSQAFIPTITVGAVTITGATRVTTIQVYAPVVIPFVSGVTIGSGSGAFPPSLALTISTLACSSTIQLFTMTVGAPIAQVTTGTVTSTSQGFAVAIAVGAVAIAVPVRPTTEQVSAPSVTTGPVTITTGTRPTSIAIFASSIAVGAVTVTTSAWGISTQMFPPVVLTAGALGGPSASSTLQMFAPTVTTEAVTIGGPTRPSALNCTAPSITTLTFVSGAHRSTTVQVFVQTVTPQAVTIGGATCSTTIQIFAPSVARLEAGAVVVVHIGSTTQLFVPTVIGAGAVSTGTVSATVQIFAPSLETITGVITGTVPITVQLFAPTVLPGLVTGVIESTVMLFGPEVEPEIGVIVVGGIDLTSQVFPPLLAKILPPTTCLASKAQVRYLVTAGEVACMMMATATVNVRYLGTGAVGYPAIMVTSGVQVRYQVTSRGVHVCCLEAMP